MLHEEEASTLLTTRGWDQFSCMKVAISQYNPKDVNNMDEKDLFYKI